MKENKSLIDAMEDLHYNRGKREGVMKLDIIGSAASGKTTLTLEEFTDCGIGNVFGGVEYEK